MMKFQDILCRIGIHKYKTVEMTDCFSTTYTDRPDIPPIKHMVWYKMCVCCGKRIVKDTAKKDTLSSRHNGIEYARTAWEEFGKMYVGDSRWKKLPDPKPPGKVVPFTIHQGGKE